MSFVRANGKYSIKGIILLLVVFGLGIIVGAYSFYSAQPRHECPVVQTSLKVNNPTSAKFLTNCIEILEWQKPDGTIAKFSVIGRNAPPSRNLTIKGMKPLSIPDHHSQNTLILTDITNNKAKIVYLSDFDHRSFGKNLRTIDCGVVELDVMENQL